MKRNKLLLIAAAALALFFLAQFAAEISFRLSPVWPAGKINKMPAMGLRSLALSSSPFTDAAFALLEVNADSPNEATVRQGMALLRRSLARNTLDYQAHYYLAKAYLRFSSVDNDYFDLGVRELKRAATIRGTNKQIVLELGKVYFSLWPLLDPADQQYAAGLLATVMPLFSWREFSPLVEMWSLYVQDTTLLMDLLRLKPEFFGPAASQLLKAALPLNQRQEMLAQYEAYTLDTVERRYNEQSLSGTIRLKDARSLLVQLRGIKGYFRMMPQIDFSQEKSAELQRNLLLQVISELLSDPEAKANLKTPAQLREYIEFYIAEHSGLNELDELQKVLAGGNYFKDNDFSSLRLKTLISYKKGDYNGVIAGIESLRRGISFVKKEQQADYTDILLLLVDAYYSTKLLTAAEAVAAELYAEQPDNPDVLWRVLRIQKILGSEGTPDKVLEGKLAAIESSRFLTVSKPGLYDVYLFNQPQVEVSFDPSLRATLQSKQLIQVFVDNKIAFESYVDELPEKTVIGPPFVSIESKVIVQVSII